MEAITVYGELIFELASKKDWVDKVPEILPPKKTIGEQWLWVDKDGHVFNNGADFSVAEQKATYPCKVYRLKSVSE